MSTITAIEQQPRRRRYNVFVDGEFAVALDPEVLAASGLKTGGVVSGDRLLELARADWRKRALDAALRLLAARPRSEREIRDRLTRRGLPADVISAAVEKLRDYGYVDDAAFARFWVESRAGGSPRGRRLLHQELRVKGIASETAAEAAAGVDERAAAQQAALKKARSLRGLDYQTYRTRLAGYLQRRGFGWEVIRPVIDELWQEQGEPLPDDDALHESVGE